MNIARQEYGLQTLNGLTTKHSQLGDLVESIADASKAYETSHNTTSDFLAPLVYLAGPLMFNVKPNTKKSTTENPFPASDWITWLNNNCTQSEDFAKKLSRLTINANIRALFDKCKTVDHFKDSAKNLGLHTFVDWDKASRGTDTGPRPLSQKELYTKTTSQLRKYFKAVYAKAANEKVASELKVRKVQTEVLQDVQNARDTKAKAAKARGSRAARVNTTGNKNGTVAAMKEHAETHATV